MADAPIRKSSQEVEIDHLLAEEFSCDRSFASRFLTASGLSQVPFEVTTAIPEPSLGGEGFGDILVAGVLGKQSIALLVEDKITAGPAIRQAERYAGHAVRLRAEGWDQVWTVLVAPSAYRGKRESYDAFVSLEAVREMLNAKEPARLAYRQAIIDRALTKVVSTGVKVPDIALRDLKAAYLSLAADWCRSNGVAMRFPALKPAYNESDTWVEHVRHPALPPHVEMRHRFKLSVRRTGGCVDLIIIDPSSTET